MSQIANSPIVVLFEDRPKQLMMYQLNLGIYLDARVKVAKTMGELKEALRAPEGVQLVVARAQYQQKAITREILGTLGKNEAKIQIVCLGDEVEYPGVVVLSDENQVKPLLQAAAKILGITAQSMVNKVRPPQYEVAPEFFQLLFQFPCDVYENGTKIFTAGGKVSRAKVAALVKKKKPLLIDSLQRLKLANAVTEQCLKASEELASDRVSSEQKMSLLAASVDMVAAQFQNSGMDEETVRLANASIKAVEKIAASATSVGNLVKQLMESQGGYRYAHCQLLTFLGFHVIKMMGWWGDDQRNTISQAAFYHDISLNFDEDAMVRNNAMLATRRTQAPEQEEIILSHPQRAARELQTSPDVSPEVVRVVLQHHGSPVGRGFSTDIAKLDNLAKTFILSEEWADYLIHLSEASAEPDNEAMIAQLKGIYKDELSGQIIETFRYLDPAEFTSDFLTAPKIRFGEEEAESEATVAGGNVAAEEEFRTVVVNEEVTVEEAPTDAAGKPIPGAKLISKKVVRQVEKKVPVKKVAAARAEKEASTTVKSVTEVRNLEKIRVQGETPEEEGETETTVPGAPRLKEKKTRVEGVTEVRNLEKIRVKGEAAVADDTETVVAGGKAGDAEGAEDQPALSPGEERQRRAAERAAQRAAERAEAAAARGLGDPGQVRLKEKKTVIEEATLVHKDEEILVKGEKAAPEASTTIENATLVHKDEEIVVKGSKEAAEETSKKLEGVTEVRNDEKIVVKGDPQSYVDRSITKIKADPTEKKEDLKVKQLKGCTDFMKMALGGDAAKVSEMLGSLPSTELRKTDAEGRNVAHYAAMGGSVEVLQALAGRGVSLSGVDSKRRSPLFLAALSKHNAAFDFLVAQGAKVNQQAMGGMTVAMVAAFSNNLHILKIAVEKGVRIDTRDHNGKTALDLARQAKATEAIQYLESLAAAKPAAKPAADAKPAAAKPSTAPPKAA